MKSHVSDPDSLLPSKNIYNDDARSKASELHEVDNYRTACEWYKQHLLGAIYNLAPDQGEYAHEDERDLVQVWCDEWVDALVEGIKLKQEKKFYGEIEDKNWASPKLIDAFKKLEAVYKLEAVLNSKESNAEIITEFQATLVTSS